MIQAALIDDEIHNLNNLKALLAAYCPEVAVTATAANAAEARTILQQHRPELLFLDIQMPGESGFELLAGLGQPDFEVIFVTAYDQYAIRAMRFAAVDYLLKPIDISELQAAVGRAVQQRRLKTQNRQLENLLQLLKSTQTRDEDRLALTTTGETRFVKTGEIVRCESSNNYTTFYLNNGETLLVSKPIYEYETLLSAYGFIRCHQSHLVSKRYVKSWKKMYGDFLLLSNGQEVPVSRGKKEEVKTALGM